MSCALALGCASKGNDMMGGSSNGSGLQQGPDAGTDAGSDASAAADDAGFSDAASAVPPSKRVPPEEFACTRGSDDGTGHIYWFCSAPTEVVAARTQCIALGGDRAIVDDEAENAMIADNIQTDSYIGYSDADEEGTWVWVDGNSATYTNWADMQPGVDDFAFMQKASGQWVTTTDVDLGFVCEL